MTNPPVAGRLADTLLTALAVADLYQRSVTPDDLDQAAAEHLASLVEERSAAAVDGLAVQVRALGLPPAAEAATVDLLAQAFDLTAVAACSVVVEVLTVTTSLLTDLATERGCLPADVLRGMVEGVQRG
jgi:hypothetical protein